MQVKQKNVPQAWESMDSLKLSLEILVESIVKISKNLMIMFDGGEWFEVHAMNIFADLQKKSCNIPNWKELEIVKAFIVED